MSSLTKRDIYNYTRTHAHARAWALAYARYRVPTPRSVAGRRQKNGLVAPHPVARLNWGVSAVWLGHNLRRGLHTPKMAEEAPRKTVGANLLPST